MSVVNIFALCFTNLNSKNNNNKKKNLNQNCSFTEKWMFLVCLTHTSKMKYHLNQLSTK